MATLQERIIGLLRTQSGLTDREITDILKERGSPQQPVNQACHALAGKGLIERRKRPDGLIGNFLFGADLSKGLHHKPKTENEDADLLSEDRIKAILKQWLSDQGWQTEIAWGKARGIDIDAFRGDERWVIEVKGEGSRNAMRVNYFLAILGETLQRMNDPRAKYSIALPDIKQFRNLWDRLPRLAKARTGITVMFVSRDGEVALLE